MERTTGRTGRTGRSRSVNIFTAASIADAVINGKQPLAPILADIQTALADFQKGITALQRAVAGLQAINAEIEIATKGT